MYPNLGDQNSRLIESTNRVGVEFLRTDLDTGLTFVRVASVTTSPEGRARNFGKALEAYRTVLRFLPRVVPYSDELMEIRTKLEQLKISLEKNGYPCE